jgi:hypothetical protein
MSIKLTSQYSKVIGMENDVGIEKHANASYRNKGSVSETKYFG